MMDIASIDIFETENWHEENIEFKHTEPVSLKFVEFGTESKIFVLNSASIVHIFLMILANFAL